LCFRRAILGHLALIVASVGLTLIATASAGAEWKPGPERYAVGEQHNVAVRMRAVEFEDRVSDWGSYRPPIPHSM